MPLECKEIMFSGHAVRRMFQRSLTAREIRKVLDQGEIIVTYQEDTPFPSYLVLDWINERPIHVVVAVNKEAGLCLVVTAYIPQLSQWHSDFKTRRKV
ncbi:MAG: DUF4258 domain-containing protein [Thermodesulfobacteriota bacterium]